MTRNYIAALDLYSRTKGVVVGAYSQYQVDFDPAQAQIVDDATARITWKGSARQGRDIMSFGTEEIRDGLFRIYISNRGQWAVSLKMLNGTFTAEAVEQMLEGFWLKYS